ncbi:MAG TPA: type II toxin-antitoxin system HicA family toxin [Paenarthrobacter sp.]|nr:type II toxin-antitoxin system HicA family toxin [Paenarthrobacter sp.]
MVKLRDLLKALERMARDRGLPLEYREGGSHTVIRIGDRQTVVPRHSEINEITARKIIKQIGE